MNRNFKMISRGGLALGSSMFLLLFTASLASAVLIHGELSNIKPFQSTTTFIYIAGYFVAILGVIVAINVLLMWAGFVTSIRIIITKGIMIMFILLFVTAIMSSLIIVKARHFEVDSMREDMVDAMMSYRKDKNMARNIDNIQSTLKCCGINGYQDWKKYSMTMETFSRNVFCHIPQSCCVGKKCAPEDCVFAYIGGSPQRKGYMPGILKLIQERIYEKVHSVGCLSRVVEEISDKESFVVQCTLLLVVVEIVCIYMLHILLRLMKVQAFTICSILTVPPNSIPTAAIRPF